MVSLDDVEKNTQFAESLQARHVLLSDPTGEVARAYGVAGIAGLFARRWTFYIDPDGVVRYVDKAVNTSSAGQDIARRLGELGFPRKEPATAREPETGK